jgi:hypothetical protein
MPNDADTYSPTSCVLALYQLISGPAEQPRDWDRFRRLCRPDARFVLATMTPEGVPITEHWDVDGFAREGAKQFATQGLWEVELTGRVERFGRIAHVFSSYATRLDRPDAPIVSRGVNSVQLLYDPSSEGGEWQISQLIWDRERPGLALPSDLAQAEDRAAA